MAGAVLRMRTCVIVLVLLLTTISVACAADQTVTLRLVALTALTLEKPSHDQRAVASNASIADRQVSRPFGRSRSSSEP